MQKENYKLYIIQENYKLYIIQENYKLDIIQENYKLYIIQENYKLYIIQENYKLYMIQLAFKYMTYFHQNWTKLTKIGTYHRWTFWGTFSLPQSCFSSSQCTTISLLYG